MRDSILKGLRNTKTTGAGVALGALFYLEQIGLALPQTKEDWITFGVSAFFTILGLLAKDATTGSAPK